MVDSVTIAIDREEKDRLDSLKLHPRETYGEVVHRLIDNAISKGKGKHD